MYKIKKTHYVSEVKERLIYQVSEWQKDKLPRENTRHDYIRVKKLHLKFFQKDEKMTQENNHPSHGW